MVKTIEVTFAVSRTTGLRMFDRNSTQQENSSPKKAK
jgi:hypothetical protein